MNIELSFTPAELAAMDQDYAEMLDAAGEHLAAALVAYRRQNRNPAAVAALALIVLEHLKCDAHYLRGLAAIALAEYAKAVVGE
jgi:hypothetical protein